MSDDRLPSSAPLNFPFVTAGPAVPTSPAPGVLGRGVRSSLFALPPLLDLLRFFCRPGVSPPPKGVFTLCRRANFAASVRAAGVEVAAAAAAAAPPREPLVLPFPGVPPPRGVRCPVPGVRWPVPGVRGVSGVAAVGVRVPLLPAASPSFARLRRVSMASRRCARISRGGRSFTSNWCPLRTPPSAPTMLATSTLSAREPSGRGVARGSRIMGVPSMEPQVICGESPSTPCMLREEARTRGSKWRMNEFDVHGES